MARDWPRLAGALALGALMVLGLTRAHVDLAPALLAGAAAAVFVAWRTVPGVWAGFAASCAAAALAWLEGGRGSLGPIAAALPWALALELFGLLTVLAVARARTDRRISRVLLGSFLGSTGIGLLGVALLATAATRAAGSALVVAALAYRLGAVPAYGWAPLLLRHPRWTVKVIGALGMAFAAAVLALVLPLLPDQRPAAATLAALSAATIPWSIWFVWRRRTTDPGCARTHVFVIAVSAVLLVVAIRLGR